MYKKCTTNNYVGMQQGQVLMQGMLLICMVNNSADSSYKLRTSVVIFLAIIVKFCLFK